MPIDELIIDFVVGWCSPAALLVALIDGRAEVFFAVGIIGVPAAHFVIGKFRAESEGNLWLKTLCICGPILSVAGSGSMFFVFAALSIPATILGLWLRRRKVDMATSITPNGSD